MLQRHLADKGKEEDFEEIRKEREAKEVEVEICIKYTNVHRSDVYISVFIDPDSRAMDAIEAIPRTWRNGM